MDYKNKCLEYDSCDDEDKRCVCRRVCFKRKSEAQKPGAGLSNSTDGLVALGISGTDIGKIEKFAERQDCSVKNLIMRSLRLYQADTEGEQKFETVGCMGD